MNKFKYLIPLIFIAHLASAQNEITMQTHKVLGAEVKGYEVNIPLGVALVKTVWETYSKDFGRSELAANHMSYQTPFKPDIYPKEILFFAQINGNSASARFWGGIDPQGIPKDTLALLQAELKTFVYGFNLKVRTNAAQKKIDESEQAATFLSKEFEMLKRDERKNERSLEKTNEKIIGYEQELVELRTDSSTYIQTLSKLSTKLDSLSTELDKVKGMVDLYKQKLEDIE
jgi:hypothetical protein